MLFRLEQRPDLEEFKRLIAKLKGWFRRHPGFEQLRRLFAELARKILKGLRVKLSQSEDLLDMKSNLETLGETWRRQWLAEGLKEGRAEGRAEGRTAGREEGREEGKLEGKAEALVCLLVKRFGALPPSLRRRIRGARLKTLDSWFKRAINAPDLRSVFNPRR